MKSKMKRILAIIVCISFILTFLPINSVSFAKPRYDAWKDKIKVYDVDKKIKAAEAEYEGYKYIATLDKDTNEIKLKVKPIDSKKYDKSLDSSSLNEERNFSVKVEYFDGENLKAKLIDEKTKEEYNIGDSDTVSAQFAIALPIALGLSEALISALLAILHAIVIGGITCVIVTDIVEKIKNSSYDYYEAYIYNGNVYIGRAIDFFTAKERVQAADFERDDNKAKFNYNVFCKNYELAEKLALTATRVYGMIEHHSAHKESPNYYPHFHTVISNQWIKILGSAHIFHP
ncbi:hypothetical protein [Caldicellulosiruptor sp. DIB 104C]|uniref:hypothetical protein n=1 Tax=Caldicellulosiruptor sp. DIB 104C TaxID=3019889 RepID=UPI0023055E27|nr:hypothetical protein [Caldicellulosiruptor sp. DIB 104C]